MRAPAHTCTKCQIRDSSPICAPSSTMADVCIWCLMRASGKKVLEEWMAFAISGRYRACRADRIDRLDAVARVIEAVAPARKYFPITDGVQVGKAFREFNFCTIHRDRAVGRLLPLDRHRQ